MAPTGARLHPRYAQIPLFLTLCPTGHHLLVFHWKRVQERGWRVVPWRAALPDLWRLQQPPFPSLPSLSPSQRLREGPRSPPCGGHSRLRTRCSAPLRSRGSAVVMGSGRRRPLLPVLLLALLLLLPAACGDCGPLPNISHAEPLGDPQHQDSFSIGSTVTYRCRAGYVKRPLRSDTIQCLTTSQWSNLPEFCGRSCPSPPRVRFAKVSQEDETQNFYAVGTTVKYICRPGYENTTDQLPTSTCFDNLTWSQVPELCQSECPCAISFASVSFPSCICCVPSATSDLYTLKGEPSLVWCSIREGEVAWSQLPACQAISCPPPPAIPNGKHNSSSTEEFTYNSVVMYACDPELQLVGNETLHCTTENGVDGVWSGSPPECRGEHCWIIILICKAKQSSRLLSILQLCCHQEVPGDSSTALTVIATDTQVTCP
uniref:Sushi domain-containing protein n=1 Tax=Strigops habroptila TaxID=2489341 RepID=A0A672V437_STRHB